MPQRVLITAGATGIGREFARAFGTPCRLFSFGDGWHSQASVALLERLGQ